MPADLKGDLEHAIAAAQEACAFADRAAIARWLGSLAVLISPGNLSVEDVKAKLAAYSEMLAGKVRRGALTRDTLDAIGRKYRFLPTYSEIAGDLTVLSDVPERCRQRLAVLLGRPPVECGLEGYMAAQEARRYYPASESPAPDFHAYCPRDKGPEQAEAAAITRYFAHTRRGFETDDAVEF